MERPVVSIVIPVLNEEDVLPHLFVRLDDLSSTLETPYEIVWVDDGSTDKSAELISQKIKQNKNHKLIRLSRNFGHQAALSAGFDEALGKAIVSMDADLQDPPELIPEMLVRWKEGVDVVYAVRKKRKENIFLRLAYFMFYRLLKFFSEINIPLDSGDFCLMDRKVVDAINMLPEHLRFIRGLRAWVGFRQEPIYYNRPKRTIGTSKYTFKRLYKLAVDGFAGFSFFPLKVAQFGAFSLGILSFCLLVIIAAIKMSGPQNEIPIWYIFLFIQMAIGSFQLLCIYLLGSYVGRTYIEAKSRPSYIIMEKIVGSQNNEQIDIKR